VTMTPEDLKAHRDFLQARGARFKALGHDPQSVPGFVLEGVDGMGSPVLDLGTGNGVLARELSRRGFQVESVDVSEEQQQIAAFLTDDPALLERISFTPVDGTSLPYPDGHFAAAVTVNALHHLVEGTRSLGEMVRVVRPGGTIVVADFNAEGFLAAEKVHEAEGAVHPVGPVTFDWARGFLAALGLSETGLREGPRTRVASFRKAKAGSEPAPYAAMDRAGLLGCLDVFAKNWLAHDGSWFLAAEKRFGIETAIELDGAAWGLFAQAEARRTMEAFGIPAGGGLDSLERALSHRMYSFINPFRIERSPDGSALRFFMESCRVQETRRRKGLPDFPCKPVGTIEFSTFARTVDPRIVASCLHCPPDPDAHGHCGWEFRLAGKDDEAK
jgi:SAM-dependent methyltransferase